MLLWIIKCIQLHRDMHKITLSIFSLAHSRAEPFFRTLPLQIFDSLISFCFFRHMRAVMQDALNADRQKDGLLSPSLLSNHFTLLESLPQTFLRSYTYQYDCIHSGLSGRWLNTVSGTASFSSVFTGCYTCPLKPFIL